MLFICQQCGNEFSKWAGRCSACGEWNTLVESKLATIKSKVRKDANKPVALSEISGMDKERLSTGMGEVDRVLGGGIVPGGVVLLAGEPGIGKSTLLLQVAMATNKVLYVSAEESASQLAGRARRFGGSVKSPPPAWRPACRTVRQAGLGSLLILAETNLENIITQIEKIRPSLAIIDSIQAITTELFSSTSGSISQARECASQLTQLAKEMNMALFIVGHITKDGLIAGPKILEHIVDTVLYFEGERYRDLRLLRSTKNRFGPVDEVGVFSMGSEGLREVKDPSQLFLLGQADKRETTRNLTPKNAKRAVVAKVGSCVVVALEGTRPLLAEIQALIVSSNLVQPRRVANGISYQRLLMLAAICQKQLHLPLFKADVYVNVSAGLTINEPAADLGICLAIYSSSKNKPLKNDLVALAEVGLLGEIRPIAQLEKRIKEAKRLGFKTIISSQNASNLTEAVRQAIIS